MSELYIEKFVDLIHKQNYIPVKYFCIDGNRCIFVKVKSNACQKFFFIEIPGCYLLYINKKEYTVQHIRKTDEDCPFNDYWTAIENFETIGLSSYFLTFISVNKNIKYELIEDFKNEKHASNFNTGDEKVAYLQKMASTLVRDKQGDRTHITGVEDCVDDDVHSTNKNKNKNSNVKVTFKDHDGEIVDHNDPVQKMTYRSKPKGGEDSFSFDDDDEDEKFDEIVDEVVDGDIGEIYLCVHLKYFFKNIKEFENILIDAYTEFEENEENENEEKYTDLVELINKYKVSVEERYEHLTSLNKNDRAHIQKLSEIIIQLGDKDNDNTNKLRDETYEMIQQLNMKIIGRRDELHTILHDSKIYVKDLIDNY